jgi:hypothetical protein
VKEVHRSTIRYTVKVRLTHNTRIYGLLKVPNMASLPEYGCHVVTCMTEGVELGQKGLWHEMGALGALPWQGTCFYDAWARFGLKPVLVAYMMTHNL